MSRAKTPLVDRARFEIDDNGCWIWLGALSPDGYGRAALAGKRPTTAHRAIWLEVVGPIDPGLHLDHVCRVRACVNPDHMDPVTPWANVTMLGKSPSAVNARKTHCPKGHPYDEENTYRHGSRRMCLLCVRKGQPQKYGLPAEHGTLLKYRRDKCRCPVCRAWNAERCYRYRTTGTTLARKEPT